MSKGGLAVSTTPYIPSTRQHEITAPQRLLKNGDIAEPGFAKRPRWQYDRADITAPAWRVKEWDCYCIVTPFPLGRWGFPTSTEQGHVERRVGGMKLGFYHGGDKRVLRGFVPKFGPEKLPLRVDLTLTEIPAESITVATPLGKPGHFYYNQKINCMRVSGTVTLGDALWQRFDSSESFAALDWGRGVWT